VVGAVLELISWIKEMLLLILILMRCDAVAAAYGSCRNRLAGDCDEMPEFSVLVEEKDEVVAVVVAALGFFMLLSSS
jgi:hypothetical protein